MAFIDNPIVASIGKAIGLDPLFAAAAGGGEPPSAPAAPAPVKLPPPGRSKQNIPPYRNRPYVPRNIGGTSGTRSEFGGMTAGDVAQMSPDVLQHPEVQELLGKFGVNPDTGSIDPHLFIHSAGLWDSHPHLAGALEGALTGAAFTRGGATAGESISNVLQGQLEGQAAHAQHVNAQLMAPFAEAHQVAQLQNEDAMIREHEAQIKHMSDMAGYYNEIAKNKGVEDELRSQAAQQAITLRQQQFELEKQRATYAEDPNRTMQEMVTKKWKAKMVKQYGDEDHIPFEESMRFYNTLLTTQGRDRMGIRYDTFKPDSANNQENKTTEHQLGVLKDQYDRLDTEVRNAEQNTMPIPDPSDPTGKRLLVPGSTDRGAFINNLKKQRDEINRQRYKLSGLPEPTSPAPSPSPQATPTGAKNPFR